MDDPHVAKVLLSNGAETDENSVASNPSPNGNFGTFLNDSPPFIGSNFGITRRWTPKVLFSMRGSENFHIYLWIAKDICWTQKNYYGSIIFGSLALAWCGVLAFHAIKNKYILEVYMLIALTMWLAGNFVWMIGKVA